MSKLRTLLLVLTFPSFTPAYASVTLYTTVNMYLSGFTLSSDGHAWVYDASVTYILTGNHRIVDNYTTIVKDNSINVSQEYQHTIVGSGNPGRCYRGSIDVTAENGSGGRLTQGAGSAQTCVPSSGVGGGDDGGGGSTCRETETADCGTDDGYGIDCVYVISPSCYTTPIILNLANGGYRLTGLTDTVLFDLDADGRKERTTWTAANAEQAFLALDRNGNGVIDDGSELFGNHTPMLNGAVAHEGFEALAELDSNHDGVIDPADAAWPRLLVWVDGDHDGSSRASEVASIAGSGVASLAYDRHFTGRRDQYGNVFRWEAQLRLGAGLVRPYYDIYFRAIH